MSQLYIILANFYAAVETELNSTLSRAPFAVSNGKIITGLSPDFPRNTAVKPGVSQALAQEKIPNLIIVRGDIQRYSDYSRRMAEKFAEIAFAVYEIKPGEFILDTSHCPIEKLTLRSAAEIIAGIVRNRKFHAGWAENSFLAEMAARTASDNCIKRITMEKTAAFLNSLPLKIIPLLQNRANTLQEMGADTIGGLLNIPRPVLKQLFGKDAASLLKFIAGETADQTAPISAKPSRLWRFHRFNQNNCEPESEIVKLITSMTMELIRQELQADNLFLSLKYTDGVTVSRSLKLAPTCDEVELMKAALVLLRQLWQRRTGLDSLKIELAAAPNRKQLAFWENRKKEQISLSVDTIRRTYGIDAVRYAMTKE